MSDSLVKSLRDELCSIGGETCVSAAALLLTEGHACVYCTLRLLCVKTLAFYQIEPVVLKRILCACAGVEEEAVPPLPEGQHCPGCADTIARCHNEGFREELVKAVHDCGYQYDCYILNVHQLVSFSIRQHSLWLFGHERLPFVVLVCLSALYAVNNAHMFKQRSVFQ